MALSIDAPTDTISNDYGPPMLPRPGNPPMGPARDALAAKDAMSDADAPPDTTSSASSLSASDADGADDPSVGGTERSG